MRSANPMDILLVEDNPDHAELTRRALHKSGGNVVVTWVKDGQEALEVLRREDTSGPSLILLDVNLPKIGGQDVLRAVKQDDRLRLIPVVMLTTSDAPEDVARSYGLGANSYVVKALDFSDFVRRVKAVWDYWSGTNVLPDKSACAST